MNTRELIDTLRSLGPGDKGLLAMDKSNQTCNDFCSSHNGWWVNDLLARLE